MTAEIRPNPCCTSITVRPPFRSVMGLVELAFDPGADVPWTLDLSQARVEHEFGEARRCRDFRVQDVGLAGEQHALGTQHRADLVGGCFRRDEAFGMKRDGSDMTCGRTASFAPIR